MSNLMEVIKSRRSTRAFKSELPPKDQIMQIVEAAEWAPSGMGKYLWHFTVIYNAEKVAQAGSCRSRGRQSRSGVQFLRCTGQHHHFLQAG